MSNNKDFKVKNGIQPTVYHEGLGTVVSGSPVGYHLQGTSYDNKSLSVGSEDVNPRDLFFKTDGTEVYFIANTNDSVFQYTLSTAWDISTASYSSKSFSVGSQELTPYSLSFKPDGTKMYIVGSVNDTIYQYSLSTAWDVTTASYDSVSFSVTSQAINPYGMFIKTDGTKLYVLDVSTDSVYQYTIGTAWDISTASYDSVSFSVLAQETTAYGVTFKADGSSMYVVGISTDSVYQYDLSTAWDISTAVYSNISFSTATQDTTPVGLFFKPDGVKMYVIGSQNDSIYQYSTVLSTAELDLSTGSVFDYTPTSDVQVTLTNPAASGTSSGATLLLGSEDSSGVSSTFSTTLYDGTATSESHRIQNGIDLLNDGGLVWIKKRDSNIANTNHYLSDTERGNFYLASNSTNAQAAGDIASYNSDGWTFNASTGLGTDYLGSSYVSWTFKKQTKFFDVVTYTGNGVAGRSISHSLNGDVGTILFKRTDSTSNWIVWHRSAGGAYGFLDADDAFTADSGISNPTTTAFTIESTINAGWNASGGTYVAYLFAHDTDASSIIKCGSYTGTGSAGKAVTLGWEPQWLMIKRTDATGYSWEIMDTQRGFASGNDKVLRANSSGVEITAYDYGAPTSTGFELTTDIAVNASGGNYIYMAIRSAFVPTITYDPDLQWSGGTAPTAPATGETDVITFNTTDGGTTYKSVLAIDGAK